MLRDREEAGTLFGVREGPKQGQLGGKCGNLSPKREEKPPGQNPKEWICGASIREVSNQCMEASLRGSESPILILKEEKYNFL